MVMVMVMIMIMTMMTMMMTMTMRTTTLMTSPQVASKFAVPSPSFVLRPAFAMWCKIPSASFAREKA